MEKINKPIQQDVEVVSEEDGDESMEKSRVVYSLPDNVKELQKLKGVGRYTAGAIASIAFGKCASVVDGNVFRVFARLKRVDEDIAVSSVANKTFWPMADNLIEHYEQLKDIEDIGDQLSEKDAAVRYRYGDFNQAIMELGRTVCITRNPKCGECPLADVCLANKAVENEEIERVEIYPVKNKKTKKRIQTVSCCIFYKEGDSDLCLYEKRPQESLLGGTWHFPYVIVEDIKPTESDDEDSDEEKDKTNTTSAQSHLALLKKFLVDQRFIEADTNIDLAYHSTIDHVFTHIKQKNHIYSCSSKYLVKDVISNDEELKWFGSLERKSAGISTVASKIFEKYKKKGGKKAQDVSPITPPKVRFKTKSPFKEPEDKSKEITIEDSSDDSPEEKVEQKKPLVLKKKTENKTTTTPKRKLAKKSETPDTKKQKQTSISSFLTSKKD